MSSCTGCKGRAGAIPGMLYIASIEDLSYRPGWVEGSPSFGVYDHGCSGVWC